MLRILGCIWRLLPLPGRIAHLDIYLNALTGVTQLNSSLLTISVIAVLLPAAFHFALDGTISESTEAKDILAVSHGVRIVIV